MEVTTTLNYTKPARPTISGLRSSALKEIALMLIALLLIDMAFFDRTRFWFANPHPFWFVVLFVACKYGTKEGLTAAVACSIVLVIGNLPEQSINQDMYAYAMFVLKLPLLWLLAALGFGELRQMHIHERDQLETALQESEEREHRIAQSYQWVRDLKDQLELRVASQLRSSVTAYKAAKSMESTSPSEVLEGVEQLVLTTLKPEQFAVYALQGDKLNLALTHGWNESDNYVKQFGAGSSLYESIIAKRETLCIANSGHERVLAGQGVMAGPLLDRDTGEIVGMLKIEKLGFMELNLSNVEAFSALCEWAGMAIVSARRYQVAKEDSIRDPEAGLFTQSYFKRYGEYMGALAKRVGFDVSMLAVKLKQPEKFNEQERIRAARALSDSVNKALRNIDLAFNHQDGMAEYSVVLPATSVQGAEIVVNKIRENLAKSASQGVSGNDFAFTVKALYEKA